MTSAAARPNHEATIVETAQSLVVAFVLAMTFRGFVTEGFVIPTGSMAPTLMGQHALLHGDQTGSDFPVGLPTKPAPVPDLSSVQDPKIGPRFRGSGGIQNADDSDRRMGDRILVLKNLLPFMGPKRWDVTVFKNPTDPDGPSANYIKRLIGMPNEMVWLADGDVFVAPTDVDSEEVTYTVRRKPEHVQRAVWQNIHHSDFIPADPMQLDQTYRGAPWQGTGWDTTTRVYRCTSAAASRLHWESKVRQIDDWTSYNTARATRGFFNVADLRIGATLKATDPTALTTRAELTARSHRFEWVINGSAGTVELRMSPMDDAASVTTTGPIDIDIPGPDEPINVEFWHVDQRLSFFIDGEEIAILEYDWSGRERMEHAIGRVDWTRPEQLTPPAPDLALHFEGSPLTLERVELDRDLYYRPSTIDGSNGRRGHNPVAPGADQDAHRELMQNASPAMATSRDKPVVLGPDHFFMLGDNSQESLDSRLWGTAHPLVAHQVDSTPFVVNRSLLIGKAWVVYFPSPFRLSEKGPGVIPDFGRLRFIR